MKEWTHGPVEEFAEGMVVLNNEVYADGNWVRWDTAKCIVAGFGLIKHNHWRIVLVFTPDDKIWEMEEGEDTHDVAALIAGYEDESN